MNSTLKRNIIVALLCAGIAVTFSAAALTSKAFAATKKPAQTKISYTASKEESRLDVNWNKVSCSGYQIKVATNKKFTHNKRILILKGKSATQTTFTDLIRGKVYYIKVRAYKQKGKSRYYGKWSSVKKCWVFSYAGRVTTKPTCESGVKTYLDPSNGAVTGTKVIPMTHSHAIPKKTARRLTGKTTHTTGVCATCDQPFNYIRRTLADKSKVTFVAPKNTDANVTNPTVTNSDGYTYNYKLYYQNSTALDYTYPEYQAYLKAHGCSTCSLTTVLNATVPALADYTPDRVIEEVERIVFGTDAVNANMSKSLSKQMPVNLKGISTILTYYGVKNKYVYKYTAANAEKEITAHLKEGNPVIVTLPGKNNYAGGTHTMVMLGLDENGDVIMGDSLKQSSGKWGKDNRLVKFDTAKNGNVNTVSSIVKSFSAYSTSKSKVTKSMYYTKAKAGNIGYVLVN